ncbi:MAG TPA: hypothetical protein VK471_07170 [Solirubrobacterales bacterium]|nr:hypothetical protein [Solirubrobacterales bacterium]
MGKVLSPNPTLKRAALKTGADTELTEIDRKSVYVRAAGAGFGDAVLAPRGSVSVWFGVEQLATALDAVGQLGIGVLLGMRAI